MLERAEGIMRGGDEAGEQQSERTKLGRLSHLDGLRFLAQVLDFFTAFCTYIHDRAHVWLALPGTGVTRIAYILHAPMLHTYLCYA